MEYLLVLSWLLLMAALTALGAPLAALTFRPLPKRGAAFALPSTLIVFTILVFWIGQVAYGSWTLLQALVTIAGGSAFVYRQGGRPQWRTVLRMYGVFLVGFLIMLLFRASSPAITPGGGEQFLHFGLVNALERAPSLPPEDFWFAGKPLRYYYGTQLQVTSWSMLSGIPVRYGFNLGIATFYGVLFVVAYGLVGAIVQKRGHSSRLGGMMGAVFVALMGPTTTPIRLLTPHLPAGIREPIARAAFGFVAQRFEDGNLSKAVSEVGNPIDWSWWYTRYVVPGTIQEVPLYSFVKGELHGHTHTTGYVLFTAALAYSYYRTPKEARCRRSLILFGGMGAVAGVFGFMNTWSLPTVGGLALVAVAAANPHPATLLPARTSELLQPWRRRPQGIQLVLSEAWRLLLAAIVGSGVILVGVAIASPFLIFGHVPRNNGIGVLPPPSPLGPFLVIYLGLLSVVTVYVAMQWSQTFRRYRGDILAAGGMAVVGGITATIGVLNFPVLAILGPILVGAWIRLRAKDDEFTLVLIVAGLGLLLSYEVVHARLPATNFPRWNTAMKVSVQAWTLGAAGGGSAAAIILSRVFEQLRSIQFSSNSWRDWVVPGRSSPMVVAAIVVIIVLLAGLVFPAMVAGEEIGAEMVEGSWEPSLDGHQNIEQENPEQAKAFQWLDARSGTPTIVEATGGSYQFTSPASVFTGLPTIVGWDHQAEYRGPTAYNRRVEHVEQIYTGPWQTAASHLNRYDVQYIYVGPNERERYGTELRSFDRPALRAAFSNDDVTIYAVNQSMIRNNTSTNPASVVTIRNADD